MSEFKGFSPALFTFLDELANNNNRDWFNANKSRYESDVREPTLAFIRAMEPTIESISPHFRADDRKSGGSMMRIYRDVRFSKDKSPYKTNVGIQFRHEDGKDVHAPGFYVHIASDELFFGQGLWQPPTPVLTQIRQKIVDEPDRWRGLVEDSPHASRNEEYGERLKRPPKGFDKDHPLVEELKRKSFIGTAPFERSILFDADFVQAAGEQFMASKPYFQFLCEALEVDF